MVSISSSIRRMFGARTLSPFLTDTRSPGPPFTSSTMVSSYSAVAAGSVTPDPAVFCVPIPTPMSPNSSRSSATRDRPATPAPASTSASMPESSSAISVLPDASVAHVASPSPRARASSRALRHTPSMNLPPWLARSICVTRPFVPSVSRTTSGEISVSFRIRDMFHVARTSFLTNRSSSSWFLVLSTT